MYEKEVEAYLRKIDDWCKMKGLEREDWCKENDHTWDNVPVEWPPQRRCVVCGLQEERSPALVAFSSDNTCHKCGSKVIAMIVDEKGCPKCRGKPAERTITEEDAASGRLEEMLR